VVLEEKQFQPKPLELTTAIQMSGILDDLKWQYKMGGFEQKIIYWNVGVFIFIFIVEAVVLGHS
jgi:hypothetical protein